MTATYVSPDDSEKDEVRFLIGDTSVASALLQDEEIEYLIDKWKPVHGSMEYVASVAAESIAAKFAREANYSADGVSISLAQLGAQFQALAAQLRQMHKNLLVGGQPDAGGISLYEEIDPTVKPLDMGTGMHDNPDAGRQAYGQRDFPEYIAEEDPGV